MSLPGPDGFPAWCRRLVALSDRDPRRAVFVARRAVAASGTAPPAIRAWANYALGWALLSHERFDEGRTRLQATVRLANGTRLRAIIPHCRFALTLADVFQHPHAGLLPELAEAAMSLEAAGAEGEAAFARIMQAVVLNVLGQAPAAIALLEGMADQVGIGTDVAGGRWRRVRAATAYGQGDFSTAAQYLKEAAQVFAALKLRVDLAKCWYEQGALAARAEQFDMALESYRRAEQVFRHFDLPFRQALCAHDSGHALIRVGAYDQALAHVLRGLSYFNSIGRTRDIGRCYLLLGNIFWFTGAGGAALASYYRAEQLFDNTGMVGGERLMARRNRALVYRSIGRPDEASALLTELSHVAARLGAQDELAAIHHDQAALLAEVGRTAEALAAFQAAHDEFLALGNRAAAAESRLEEGWLLLLGGRIAEAAACFRAAAAGVELQPHSRWRNDYGFARCAAARGEHDVALSHYRAACSTVALLRGRLASEFISSTIYKQAEGLHQDAMRLALELDDGLMLLRLSEGQRALVLHRLLASHPPPLPDAMSDQYARLLNGHIQRSGANSTLEDPLAAEPPDVVATFGELLLQARQDNGYNATLGELSTDAYFDLNQVRRQLNDQYGAAWTALVYIMLDASLVIAVITPASLELRHEGYDLAFQRLVRRAGDPAYRRYIYDDLGFQQGREQHPWEPLRTLGHRLIPQSVRARLQPHHRLIIVPTSSLHALPWAALRVGESWLMERAVIQLAPSLTIMQHLGALQPTVSAEALLIGCSDFHGCAPDLPGIAEELAIVATQLPGVSHQLIDADASCGAVRNRAGRGELRRYGLIHIASHARMLPGNGRAARVMLDDGELALPEIARLKLSGALVVLSACDGAGAELLPGEEALSLGRAFIAAGARGVLASLWPVYDRAAITLMRSFYRALTASGDAAAALAEAQRELAGAGGVTSDPLASPRCWASFLLVGDSRQPSFAGSPSQP